ncbi:Oxidoreductase, aldo/keto reductase family [Azospirillum largimobile]
MLGRLFHWLRCRDRSPVFTFIDTADVYHCGTSERVVGSAIRGDRDARVLATKFANPMGEGPNSRGILRKWIVEAVENSLRRLGTDYIDIAYIHRTPFDASLDEAVQAIADLIRAGKLRYFGVSNFSGWRIAEIVHLADAHGIDRPVASQPLYNIVDRQTCSWQRPALGRAGIRPRWRDRTALNDPKAAALVWSIARVMCTDQTACA